MTEIELICKGLTLIREALINIRKGREEYNTALIDDINEVIIDLEQLEDKQHHA